VLVLAFAGAIAATGRARLPAQAATAAQANRSWPQVGLNVAVLDKDGNPNATLTASEFQVFEDRSARTVESVSTEDAPMSVAFAIDTSGSMYKQSTRISTVVRTVTQALPAGSEMAAIEFSDTPHVEQPLAPAAGNGLSVLEHLDARGCTALLDAVIEAEQLLANEAHFARRALVLIGDGGDNCSTHSLDELTNAVEQAGAASIYAFILKPVVETTAGPTEQGGRVMGALIHRGGAVEFAPRKDQELPMWADRIAAAVRSQYLLTITATDADKDGRRHAVEVRVPIRNVSIFAIPSYFAPAD
jgi:Ca-activated chloride channel homolog